MNTTLPPTSSAQELLRVESELPEFDNLVELDDTVPFKLNKRTPRFTSYEQEAVNAAYSATGARPSTDTDATFQSVAEEPWHSGMVTYAAQGMNAKQICEQYGGKFENNKYVAQSALRSYGTICMVLRQPWFKLKVTQLLNSAGQDHVFAHIEKQVLPSLNILITLRDDPKTPPAARISACKELLDRFLGKATEKPLAQGKKLLEPEDELEAINRELEKIKTLTA